MNSDGLRVVAYNIRQGFGVEGRFDLEAVARTLEDNPADVIALQEVGRGWVISGAVDTLTWLSQRLDMPYAYGPTAADLWGNAVLTRMPMRSAVHHFDNPGRIPRGAVAVEIDAPGLTYTVINAHLDHETDGGPTREDQARTLLDIWGGRTQHAGGGRYECGVGRTVDAMVVPGRIHRRGRRRAANVSGEWPTNRLRAAHAGPCGA